MTKHNGAGGLLPKTVTFPGRGYLSMDTELRIQSERARTGAPRTGHKKSPHPQERGQRAPGAGRTVRGWNSSERSERAGRFKGLPKRGSIPRPWGWWGAFLPLPSHRHRAACRRQAVERVGRKGIKVPGKQRSHRGPGALGRDGLWVGVRLGGVLPERAKRARFFTPLTRFLDLITPNHDW